MPQFLELAISAAGETHFSGICLIIDRQAERQSRLLQYVVEKRSSLHDITAQDILIIVSLPDSGSLALPPPSTSYFMDRRKKKRKRVKEDGYRSPGLVLADGVSRKLEKAFWRKAGEPEGRSDIVQGYWSTIAPKVTTFVDYPDSEEKLQRAITEAASETARFLGLNERWIPCLSLLGLADKRIFVFRYGLHDEPYEFFKLIMEQRPENESPAWLSPAIVAAADKLGLQSERSPELVPLPLAGWSYTCYGARSIPRLSAETH